MTSLVCPFCQVKLEEHYSTLCLDGWIALVLGWTIWLRPFSGEEVIIFYAPGENPATDTRFKKALLERCMELQPDAMEWKKLVGRPPRYSTEWQEAGALLEIMVGGRVEHKGELWYAECQTGERTNDQWRVPRVTRWPGETGPHAIARAFLAGRLFDGI